VKISHRSIYLHRLIVRARKAPNDRTAHGHKKFFGHSFSETSRCILRSMMLTTHRPHRSFFPRGLSLHHEIYPVVPAEASLKFLSVEGSTEETSTEVSNDSHPACFFRVPACHCHSPTFTGRCLLVTIFSSHCYVMRLCMHICAACVASEQASARFKRKEGFSSPSSVSYLWMENFIDPPKFIR
jgi:hypothetical protein